MTTTDHAIVENSGSDAGERHATELAARIRALAATDPGLAQGLVDQLIENLNRATDGAFREHLEGDAPKQRGDSSPGNS